MNSKTISFTLGFALLLGLFAQCSWASGPISKPAPKLYTPKTEFNFDPVFDGQKVNYTFEVENRGKSPLLISKASGG